MSYYFYYFNLVKYFSFFRYFLIIIQIKTSPRCLPHLLPKSPLHHQFLVKLQHHTKVLQMTSVRPGQSKQAVT